MSDLVDRLRVLRNVLALAEEQDPEIFQGTRELVDEVGAELERLRTALRSGPADE